MQIWTHFLWLLLVSKIVLYIWSYHKWKTVSHRIINIFCQRSLEVLIWPCPSLKFRKRQIFCKRESQQALHSLFYFFAFHPLPLSCSTGRGLRFTSQENGYGTETILFALSCGCLRKVVYLLGVEQIMWTLKRCGALPLAFRHAPLLLEFSLGLEKRKATLNCFNLGFFSWLSAVSFPFFKTQYCRQRVWRIMCGRNTWAQFSLKYV